MVEPGEDPNEPGEPDEGLVDALAELLTGILLQNARPYAQMAAEHPQVMAEWAIENEEDYRAFLISPTPLKYWETRVRHERAITTELGARIEMLLIENANLRKQLAAKE